MAIRIKIPCIVMAIAFILGACQSSDTVTVTITPQPGDHLVPNTLIEQPTVTSTTSQPSILEPIDPLPTFTSPGSPPTPELSPAPPTDGIFIVWASKVSTIVGAETTMALTLENAESGLSGYDIRMQLANPSVGVFTAVRIPKFGLTLVGDLPTDSLRLQAVDLNELVLPGDDKSLLAEITIQGSTIGESVVEVLIRAMDDELGNPIFPKAANGTLVVGYGGT